MSSVINFKTDEKLKKQAQQRADKIGLSLSMVLNLYLREFANASDVNVKIERTLSPTVLRKLSKAEEQIDKNEVSPVFDNARDALRWLKK